MANKQIKDFAEDTAPVDGAQLITQTSGVTKKSSLINLLKRVFGFDDVWDDYLVHGLDLDHAGGSTAPSFLEFRDGLYQHAFTGTGNNTNEGHFTVHLKHGLKANTDMMMHIHWSHNNAAPSGDVKWYVDYTVAKAFVGNFGAPTTLSTVQTVGPQYQHMVTTDEDMVITASNGDLEPDTILIFRIYRDPTDLADTFNDFAFIFNIDLHYVKSRVGTRERIRPYTSGGFPA